MTVQDTTQPTELKDQVRQRYGQIAQGVLAGGNGAASCCGPANVELVDGFPLDAVIPLKAASSCCSSDAMTTAGLLYAQNELTGLPESVTGAALGCGNPTAIAVLRPGQTVLDLGSGGGIDCFLAARQVGPTGQVIGLDMTPDMLALAERNKARLGEAASNVRFVRGEIEAMPLPDGEVDVIISNCVINLSLDKDAVFCEAFRVLRPGGCLAVSDTVALQPFSEEMLRNADAWSACATGSLDIDAYRAKLHAAGFDPVDISDVTPTDFGLSEGVDDGAAAVAGDLAGGLKSWIASARIVAHKPLQD
jgi:SAM-dependent methyltransferase